MSAPPDQACRVANPVPPRSRPEPTGGTGGRTPLPDALVLEIKAPGPNAPRPRGFRLTLRHQFILVVAAAVLSSALVPVVESSGSSAAFNALLAALLLAPWALAVAVLALDRAGPLKYWAAPLLLSLFAPASALCYDLSLVAGWISQGLAPRLIPTVLVNVVFGASFVTYLRATWPLGCPACGRRALIPLLHLWGKSPRTTRTRWCAECGSTFWRGPSGPWRVERRQTWTGPRPTTAA